MTTRHWLARTAIGCAAAAITLPLMGSAPAVAATATAATPSITAGPAATAATPQPSPTIREAQQRLKWAGLYGGPVNGLLNPATRTATRRVQEKFLLTIDGIVGPQTLGTLKKITPYGSGIDKRCYGKGHIVCADVAQRIVRYYVDGKLNSSADARYGRVGKETTLGHWKIYLKSRDHYSTKYDAAMPYSLFFYKGEAVHFSDSFAKDGYKHPGSHGCINLRDKSYAKKLFQSIPSDTKDPTYQVKGSMVVYDSTTPKK